jgi:hypothetical protein
LALLAANIVVLVGEVFKGVEIYLSVKVDANTDFYPACIGISQGNCCRCCLIHNLLVLLVLFGFIGCKCCSIDGECICQCGNIFFGTSGC